MIDLLIEYRHWLAGTVIVACFGWLFVVQEVSRKRHLSRMAKEGRDESRREG